MNKEKALMQLKDLLYNFKNFESVETTEEDVQALKYVIKELTAQEVPVQEQSNKLIITIGNEVILEKDLNKNFI